MCGYAAANIDATPEGSLLLYKPYRSKVDNSTWANTGNITTSHYHLDLMVNFTAKNL